MPARVARHLWSAALLALGLSASGVARAGKDDAPLAQPGTTTAELPTERMENLPQRLHGVEVDEKLGTKLPLHLRFRDEQGAAVELGSYFTGSIPVILTLNYSDCPMLCSLQLNGFTKGLSQLAWLPGREFRVLTISLDPKESVERAAETKRRYLAQLGRSEAAKGWHFLTGTEASIRALAAAIGFSYNYNEKRKEYVHPAALALASPSGTLVRYLYGIEYLPQTLRLALVESSEGKIGTTVDRILLFCFHYDATEGRYAPVVRNIMKLGGAGTVLALATFLSLMWRTERRRKLQAV
jgi:protein SCO1/2